MKLSTNKRSLIFGWALILAWLPSSGNATNSIEKILADTPILKLKIIEILPHPRQSFTQGLILHQGYIIESSGNYKVSKLFRYKLGEATMQDIQNLPQQFFAEGLTLHGDKLYQLTWKKGRGFIYDAMTLSYLSSFEYNLEGWGLTSNGKELIRSDGSNNLFFHSAEDFSLLRSVKVHANNKAVYKLNELEWIDNYVFANIWQSDYIVKIDPMNGKVVAKINLSLLRQKLPKNIAGVANGIAYDAHNQHIYLTGKYWPMLFKTTIQSNQSGPTL